MQLRINGSTPISELYHADDEVYHHGVKGMKWGVRKTIRQTSENARRLRRAVSAANIERKQARIERTISRNKALTKKYKLDYTKQNKSYRSKLKRLRSMRDRKISDLSDADIERGRAMYKTLKNVGVSVTITAAAATVGTAYAPAALTAKLIGAGLTTAINSSDNEN